MARSDLLVTLVKAANSGDRPLVRKTVEAMAAEERAKNHLILAQQLESELQPAPRPEVLPIRSAHQPDLLIELTPRKTLADLVLSAPNRQAIDEVVQEHHRTDLLRSYNLSPRNRILLTGPPGNGKTSLAEAVAHAVMLPLVVARYDALITSFLGETATRLRRLFEFAHTRRCVLFFDEFDTLGKERGDLHETGEIKRVVSSLLLQIDDLPAHVVVICATNHPELLDRAVWRRFQLKLDLGQPNTQQVEAYLSLLATRMNLDLGMPLRTLAKQLAGDSYADIEEFVTGAARSYVLALPGGDVKAIIARQLKQRTAAKSSTMPKRIRRR